MLLCERGVETVMTLVVWRYVNAVTPLIGHLIVSLSLILANIVFEIVSIMKMRFVLNPR